MLLSLVNPASSVSRMARRSGYGMGKVTVHGEFSRQWEHRYLQQLQFRKLLSLSSIHESPYQEFEAHGARNPDLLSRW
jgi:hypothetical protein